MSPTPDYVPLAAAPPDKTPWLGLVAGNSRLHWGAFVGAQWIGSWHTPHLTGEQVQRLIELSFAEGAWAEIGTEAIETQALIGPPMTTPPELWMASVVKAQQEWWLAYHPCRQVALAQVPLERSYATLGVDRALALVGAGDVYGWPVLVVDGGTALTLTAGANRGLAGGAILPGLRSQFRALHDYTDGLPLLAPDLERFPPRWAITTADAMASGVLYSQLAGLRDFITDWRQCHGAGQVIFTGGDGLALAMALVAQNPTWQAFLQVDPNVMFWGLRVCRQRQGTAS